MLAKFTNLDAFNAVEPFKQTRIFREHPLCPAKQLSSVRGPLLV